MSSRYRVGIIGCGVIGKHHANGYLSVPGMEIVAAAEVRKEISQEFKKTFSVPAMYLDAEEMLQKESLDVVSICTWHLLHAPQTVLATEHGVKAVLCEKPMADRLSEADQMLDVCSKNGTKLAIAHQRRFYPGWTEARRLISEGAIGRPVLATCEVWDGLLNCGSHVIDATRYLLGDPMTEWVMGALERKTNRWERSVPIEDCCLGLMQFAGGTQGLVQVDLTSRRDVERLTVQGTEGMLTAGPNEVQMINSDTVTPETRHMPWSNEILTSAREVGLEGREVWVGQALGLKAWLDGETDYRCDGLQARQTMEIMMAIYQSARDHEVVRMPLTVEDYPMSMMIDEGKLPVQYAEEYDIRSHQRQDWKHRRAYDELRTAGVPHPEIMAKILKET